MASENVALPDICADAKALAADGFTSAPASTEQFLASSSAASSITRIEFGNGESGDLEERIARRLKPYESSIPKALLPHKLTKAQVKRLLGALKREIGTPVLEIAQALGLPE